MDIFVKLYIKIYMPICHLTMIAQIYQLRTINTLDLITGQRSDLKFLLQASVGSSCESFSDINIYDVAYLAHCDTIDFFKFPVIRRRYSSILTSVVRDIV